jgi:hypothetical protein
MSLPEVGPALFLPINIHPVLQRVTQFELDDIIAVVLIAAAYTIYITRGIVWAKQEPGYHLFFESPQGSGLVTTVDAGARNIVEKIKALVGFPHEVHETDADWQTE